MNGRGVIDQMLAQLARTPPEHPTPQSPAVAFEQSAQAAGQEFVPTPDVPPPNGPFDPFEFRWGGETVDFADAPLRFRLVSALWDESAARPRSSRLVTDVMGELYPDDDEADDKFKNLAKQVRKCFERKGMGLTIRTAGGKIWLAGAPD